MKTVYTDKYGIFHWAMLAAALGQTYLGIRSAMEADWGRALLNAGAAGAFFYLAAKRMLERRAALRDGRDPSVVRISEK